MLREWVSIDPATEFRCFIYRNKLTAISQYHCYNRYKALTPQRVIKIRDSIVTFYRNIFPYLPYEDSIMDVVVEPSDRVYIVEFNSFGADGLAGSGLYNWIRDESILLDIHQEHPDIRVVT